MKMQYIKLAVTMTGLLLLTSFDFSLAQTTEEEVTMDSTTLSEDVQTDFFNGTDEGTTKAPTTEASSSVMTTGASRTTSATGGNDEGLSAGAIAGIAVGSVVAAVLIVILLLALVKCCCGKNTQQVGDVEMEEKAAEEQGKKGVSSPEKNGNKDTTRLVEVV